MPDQNEIAKDYILPLLEKMKGEIDRGSEISPRMDLSLFGRDGIFDSIELVRFLVILEEEIRKKSGAKVRLMTDAAFMEAKTPFKNVSTLATFVAEMIQAQRAGSGA